MSELAGRAVTLARDHMFSLLAAGAVLWLPCAILSAFAFSELAAIDLPRLITLAMHPPAPELQAEIARMQRIGRPETVVTFVLTPLAEVAVILTAASYIDGRPITPPAAVRAALRLWPSGLVVGLAFWLLTTVVVGAASLLLVIAFLPVSLLAAAFMHARGMPLVLGTLAVPTLLVVLLTSVLMLATTMAYVMVALEDSNPIRVTTATLRRVFDRRLAGRTLIAALIYAVVNFGTMALLVAAWLFAAPLHAVAATTIGVSVVGAAINAVLLTFVMLFTRDVALRRGETRAAAT